MTFNQSSRALIVTGSSGLIGSEVCSYFAGLGAKVHGVDSNQRAAFFGPQGDTRWNQRRLQESLPGFEHHELDIRDRAGVLALIDGLKPAAIVHCAAQPSHDRAAAIPFDDFDTNAVGTHNLLEAARRSCPDSPFVHMSTNKVYGDAPNLIKMTELAKRWEYGRYFGMPTCCLRGGCLTGPNHSGVELHGFLSYLVRCNLEGRTYRVFGYKGKQVRDNIHSLDVARFIHRFIDAPRAGEVYNLGGGRGNSCSILEAFDRISAISGIPMKHEYVEEARRGDHICYISDLGKMKSHYPGWDITKSLADIFTEIHDAWRARMGAQAAGPAA
jgi:CDP-paratose 2-epimerase